MIKNLKSPSASQITVKYRMYSSAVDRDSRDLFVVQDEKVDAVALNDRENLQLKTSGWSLSSKSLAMLHILHSMYS